MMTSREIRQSFLDFFKERGHRIVPSAPVVPHGDPTLLFTNAGMNQFKDVFLGTGKRDYSRAADTQKCIRVSGKHNDLEEVGYDTYHHTLFEMLGNWSFGDYYKEEAIAWSWQLLTDVWKLPKDRLYATVYRTDDESYHIWKKYLPEEHILRFDEKDNFWEMGDTGPCGPCTEIHFDRTQDKSGRNLVNAGVQDVIEIWNNVFIQYNRKPDGSLEELTQKHVDTGMGFERICAVIQGTPSNYETDVFMPIIEKIEAISGKDYDRKLTDPIGVAMRVIADHIRTLSFAIADGAIPGSEGRGYVLRRILRRASRYARNLDIKEPVLYKLVEVLVQTMGDVFPEITEQQHIIERVIKAEEVSFLETLERGLERLQMIVGKEYHNALTGVTGEDAFQLYDTYGFPLDLTQLLAREYGLTVDTARFDELMKEQQERSRQARKQHINEVIADGIQLEPTRFTGYEKESESSEILYAQESTLVFKHSPLYAESGGQQSDYGSVSYGGSTYNVIDVRKANGVFLHICDREVEGSVGDVANISIDVPRRWHIQRNHSATHILHEALRRVLGAHVKQSGSLVTPEHLRFDFAHFEKVSSEELQAIEDMVNDKIMERIGVYTLELPIEEAQKVPNVKMFFGDKYGDFVRVVVIDEKFSAEFCGGTHVLNTNDIGLFKITTESAVAAGIRRIEAVTGKYVGDYINKLHHQIQHEHTNTQLLGDRIKHLEKELSKFQTSQLAGAIPEMVSRAVHVQGVNVVSGRVAAGDLDQLKELGDSLRNELKHKGIGLLATELDGKAQLVCVVTDDMVNQFNAGKLVGKVAKILGGGGGGKAHIATAGGKDVAKLDYVLSEFPLVVQGIDIA
jgi:alanyl-tRNA synthetase